MPTKPKQPKMKDAPKPPKSIVLEWEVCPDCKNVNVEPRHVRLISTNGYFGHQQFYGELPKRKVRYVLAEVPKKKGVKRGK